MLTTGLPRNLELCDEVKECSLLDSRLLLPDSTDCHYYYECLWTSTQQGFVRRFCQDGVIGVVDADTDVSGSQSDLTNSIKIVLFRWSSFSLSRNLVEVFTYNHMALMSIRSGSLNNNKESIFY